MRESNKTNKQAQLKIQEMAFVLVAVIFLGGLLLLFFARFQMSSLQKAATEIKELRTITMLRVVASMPELSCREEAICIDEDKLKAFNSSTSLQNKYAPLWQSSDIVKIIVEEVYPQASAVNYTIYKKTPAGNTVTYSTFIPLCSESKQGTSCKIAKIKITTIVP
ncbi:MAG: hypothetical protein ACPLXC_01770 [Candidatus Pacearchaeota archaeon]